MNNKKIIWLASYPKSGNTWFRIVLTNYLKEDGEPLNINNLYPTTIASNRVLFDEATGVSSSDLTLDEIDALRPHVYKHIAENSDDLVFHKIHDAWQVLPNGESLIPKSVTKGVIYIIRNPLDVAVSFAHHSATTVDAIIKAMGNTQYSLCEKGTSLHIQLRQKLLTWSKHLESWLDNSKLPLFLMKYEDMLINPFETFKKALKFVYGNIDENKLVKAIEESSFEKIKEQELQIGFKERNQKSSSFFRKGKMDSWQDILTDKQVDAIYSDHKEMMRRFGYCTKRNEMKTEVKIDNNSIIKRNDALLFSRMDEEVVMLSIENSEYYSMNNVGSRIWEIIKEPKKVSELIEILINEYEVEKIDCETDVLPYLDELLKKNVILKTESE